MNRQRQTDRQRYTDTYTDAQIDSHTHRHTYINTQLRQPCVSSHWLSQWEPFIYIAVGSVCLLFSNWLNKWNICRKATSALSIVEKVTADTDLHRMCNVSGKATIIITCPLRHCRSRSRWHSYCHIWRCCHCTCCRRRVTIWRRRDTRLRRHCADNCDTGGGGGGRRLGWVEWRQQLTRFRLIVRACLQRQLNDGTTALWKLCHQLAPCWHTDAGINTDR